MPLQSSGPISLLDIQNEFGGSNPIGINEYYGAGGAPSSGTISIGNFYGRSASSGLTVEVLLMAGGGQAHSDEEDPKEPGGGGAGGLFTQSFSISGSSSVTVGGSDSNTSFVGAPTSAIAGGRTFSGGESLALSYPGGSGGGGSCGGRGSASAGTGTPGQGNPGGPNCQGGGGGKNSPGGDGTGPADGGTGYDIALFRGGPALTVAFGGPGKGPDVFPAANTGGGGCIAFTGRTTVAGGGEGGIAPGGSGIAIVRYPGSTQRATGGNSQYVRVVGGATYYFHEFTTSGTFTVT